MVADFYDFCAQGDFGNARALLDAIQENRIGNVYELRRHMNKMMAEEDSTETKHTPRYTPMDSDTVDRYITNFHE